MAQEEFDKDSDDLIEYDPWTEDDWLRSTNPDYRPFPATFEYTADEEDGPRIVTVDLRTLPLEELENMVPSNRFAFLEILYRELRNIQ
jgi:hypothetical protein